MTPAIAAMRLPNSALRRATVDDCAQLLEFTVFEPFVALLLALPMGQWLPVKDAVARLGLWLGRRVADVPDSAAAAWLDSPDTDARRVLIVFYDAASGAALTCEYDSARRLRRA